MEKRKQIDAEDLKDAIKRSAYPIGFDYDEAFSLRKSDCRGKVVNAGMLYGLRNKDIMTVIDEMPSVEESNGALEKLEKKYEELENEYNSLMKYFGEDCVNKNIAYLDIEYALNHLGISLTNDQFLELLKKELDNPSYDYEDVRD